MPIKTYREAINEALLQEMKKDENVVVIGEDVAGGAGTNGEQDAWGGVLGVTKGLLKHFGRERIIDTPITETAIMGMASGACAATRTCDRARHLFCRSAKCRAPERLAAPHAHQVRRSVPIPCWISSAGKH